MLRSWLSVRSRHHSRMVLAFTLVRGLVVLSISRHTTFDLSITVPCDFNTPISVYVGGKEVKISPESFNLGPISAGSNTCVAGAASDAILTVEIADRKLASDNLPVKKLTSVQNFGFLVTFSCGMLTLLGTLVRDALGLLTSLRPRRGNRCSFGMYA